MERKKEKVLGKGEEMRKRGRMGSRNPIGEQEGLLMGMDDEGKGKM